MKKLKGFTLIELLIVIIIIGVLATIMIVSYSSTTGKAKKAATVQSLNDAINGTATCLAAGDTVNAYTQGGSVCTGASGSAVTSAVYPATATLTANGYSITGTPSVNTTTGVITYGTAISGTPAITCTVGSNCQ